MAIPRKLLYDDSAPVVLHCVSRLVRRLYLLADESLRRMLVDRLRFLVTVFAIDVLEWAVLENHFHVVLATHPDLVALWSDREIAERFRALCPDRAWRRRANIPPGAPPQPEEIEDALARPQLIARWRRQLASPSTFHKFLKQRIARLINEADDVTGHCWEGRFKSIVALDDEAVVAHMVYVALNPVRAGMAEALDEYEFASIGERVEDLKRRIRAGEFAGEAEAAREKLRAMRLVPALPCNPGSEATKIETLANGLPNPWFGGRVPSVVEGASVVSFIAQVEAAGRMRRLDKRGFIPDSAAGALAELDRALAAAGSAAGGVLARALEIAGSLEEAMARGAWGTVSGGAAALARHAKAMSRRFVLAIAGRREDGFRRRVAAASD
ncbi:MAG: hypothetical protein U0572_03785 [Phycisphaerales bacterium]